MTTLEIAVSVLLWGITAWRAPRVWRKGKDRTLWWAFFGVSITMTLRLPLGQDLDRSIGIVDLSFLLKHISGGVLGAAALLAFLRNVSGNDDSGSWQARIRVVLPITAATAMTALFVATPQPHEAEDLLTDYAQHGTILAYGIIFLAYLSTALFGALRVCWRWGRDSGNGSLAWGLRLIGLGMASGVVYALHRITNLVTRYFGHTVLDHTTSTFFLVVAVLLILAGSTLPALTKIRSWSTDRRSLLRLYPLWRRLTDAAPSVRLDPPRSRVAERLDPRNPHGRLYRRTIEIRDAALALSDHAPAEIRAKAQAHVAASGLIGTQADTAVEACWLEVARRSRLRGEAPANKHHRPSGGGRDLASEISALSQLSDAYHSALTGSFAEAMDRTRTLEMQP
ncbi:MAB_1171c family putative transporter [Streptomyces sp. NPDC001880]